MVESSVSQIPFIESKDLNLDDNTKQRYVSKHKYSLKDWGIDLHDLHEQFDFYHQEIFKNSKLKYRNE